MQLEVERQIFLINLSTFLQLYRLEKIDFLATIIFLYDKTSAFTPQPLFIFDPMRFGYGYSRDLLGNAKEFLFLLSVSSKKFPKLSDFQKRILSK